MATFMGLVIAVTILLWLLRWMGQVFAPTGFAANLLGGLSRDIVRLVFRTMFGSSQRRIKLYRRVPRGRRSGKRSWRI